MTLEGAALIEARRLARNATLAELRRQGRKPQHLAHKAISALAEEYLAAHRAELIEEARERVERWLAEYTSTRQSDETSVPSQIDRVEVLRRHQSTGLEP